jgi:hypothetical protein
MNLVFGWLTLVHFFLACFQDMVQEEYIMHAERHMPRTPANGVFYSPSSAE